MTINISQGEAVVLLTDAVKEKGAEYVYKDFGDKGYGSTCVYTRDGEPSCIVGHALANAGVPLSVLEAIDYGKVVILRDYDPETDEELDEPVEVDKDGGIDDTGINDGDVLYWLSKNDVTIDERALRLFSNVQHAQDNGTPWGKAVADAIATVNR